MANQFSKKDVDFDVYERESQDSNVDWAKQAKDITDTFETIRDDRKTRKDALLKTSLDQQDTLNDIGEYDSRTAQEVAMRAGNDGGQKALEAYEAMTRGDISPADYNMWVHKQKTGFTLLKKNLTNFDATFKDYAERTNKDKNAPQEIYIASLLEGFANLNGVDVQTNALTGDVGVLRVNPDGSPVEGKSMTIQQIAMLMKQKTDKFDVGAAASKMKAEIGTYIDTAREKDGITQVLTTVERSRAEAELYATEDGAKLLTLKAEQMISNPQHKVAMLVKNVKLEDGSNYRLGTEDEYIKEGGDGNKNNPVVIFQMGEDGLMRGKLSDTQEEAALNYAKAQIQGTLSVKVDKKLQKIQATVYWKPKHVMDAGDDKKRTMSLGRSTNMFITGDASESSSGALDIINSVEGLNGLDKNGNTITIYSEGNEPYDIDVSGMSPEEAVRSVYVAVGAESDFDTYIDNNGDIGASIGEGNTSERGRKKEKVKVKYRRNNITVDGADMSAGDYLVSKLDEEISDWGTDATISEIKGAFDFLLNNPAYNPKEFETNLKVNRNKSLSITMNGKKYNIPYVNNVRNLEGRVKRIIEDEVKRVNSEEKKETGKGKLNGQ